MLRSNSRMLALVALAVLVYLVHLAAKPHINVFRGGAGRGADAPSSQKRRPLDDKRAQAPLAAPHQHKPLTDHPLRASNLDIDFPGVELDTRGHVLYDPAIHATQHPITLLMERAKKQAANIEDRIKAVKTVADAAKSYEDEWKMKPPKGFETWYTFVTKTNGVPLASMFPMAHKPFLQYLSYPAKVLRERIESAGTRAPMYTLEFVPDGQGDMGTQCDEDGVWWPEDAPTRGRGRVKVGGPWGWRWRCNNTLNLILPILPKLPEEFFTQNPPIKLAFNADDGPRTMDHHDFQIRAETYGQALKLWPEAQLEAAEQRLRYTYGWQWTCPADSPLKQSSISKVLNDEEGGAELANAKSFVGDFYMSTDVCYNPDMRELNSAMLHDERFASNPPSPIVSVSRSLRNSDICMIPLDAVFQEVGLVKWKDKTDARVFWRGSPTGITHKKSHNWRASQRHRLNDFANNKSTAAVPILVERNGQIRAEAHRVKDMNEKWFDIGLTGGPAQCDKDECEVLRKAVEWKPAVRGTAPLLYKYVVDVDGNAWSSRFRRLLLSNHCVLKSTAFPEWFNDLLVPWYHYVPIRHDYADVYDIMAFFEGAPDGSTKGNSDLAGEIALNGHNFVRKHWRESDMQSFMLLLLLEFWRLLSDDREAMAFKP